MFDVNAEDPGIVSVELRDETSGEYFKVQGEANVVERNPYKCACHNARCRKRKELKRLAKFKAENEDDCYIAELIQSMIIRNPADGKFYCRFTLRGSPQYGMLDSGARPIICNDMELIRGLNVPMKDSQMWVKTADGAPNKVVKEALVPYEFDGKLVVLNTYIVPTFKTRFLLGTLFWDAFGIGLSTPNGLKCPVDKSIIPDNMEEIDEADMVHFIEAPEPEQVVKVEPPPAIKLTDPEKDMLEEVKRKFPASAPDKIGMTPLLEFDIDVGEAKPINQRQYEISPYILDRVKVEVKRMEDMGVVSRCETPTGWSSPFVIVNKPDGRIRLCIDLRKINAVTVNKDAYPLPNISTILSQLQDTKYISAIDLKDAFWQLKCSERTQKVLAFKVPGMGFYQINRMPFGAVTASQHMVRLMDMVIGHDLEPHVFVYLDDIVVVTGTFEKHVEILAEVARRLEEAKLTISVEKSRFCLAEMKFLGFIIDARGIRVDPEKVECIAKFPRPTSVREIRRFIGMAGYYRRFVPNFSELSAPMTNLISKKGKLQWSLEAEHSFKEIKRRLMSAPILVTPKWNEMFTIHTDASDYATGAMLTQGEGEDERPIAYMSRKMIDAQTRYTTTEKECLAILLAVKHFRCYVDGVRFKIITDHAALKWLNSLDIKTGRLARWIAELSQYDYVVEHRKGPLHVIPDALSRIDNAPEPEIVYEVAVVQPLEVKRGRGRPRKFPVNAQSAKTAQLEAERKITETTPVAKRRGRPPKLPSTLNNSAANKKADQQPAAPTVATRKRGRPRKLVQAETGAVEKADEVPTATADQENSSDTIASQPVKVADSEVDQPLEVAREEPDADYMKLIKDIQKCPKGYLGYRVFDGKIYRFDKTVKLTDEALRWKEMVPNNHAKEIIRLHHEVPLNPHMGFAKTYEKVKVHYWWPTMAKDIRKYVAECTTCGQIKAPNYITTAPLRSHPIPMRKFDVLCLDFATELPRSKKGNTCFFVGVDLLTKYPIGYASRQADGKTMIQFLSEKFMELGVPHTIISDNGKQFVSKEFQNFLTSWKVAHKTTPFYHPQANPAERVVKSMKDAIRAFAMDNHALWDEHLHEF